MSATTALTTRASAGGANDVQALPRRTDAGHWRALAQASVFPVGPSALMSLAWQTPSPQLGRLPFGCGWSGWTNANHGPASADIVYALAAWDLVRQRRCQIQRSGCHAASMAVASTGSRNACTAAVTSSSVGHGSRSSRAIAA